MLQRVFVDNFDTASTLVSPSYLLESPYKELLMAVAHGDGKFYTALRKSKLSEALGENLIKELVSLGILTIEYSRESPLRIHPKHKLKKEQRSYRIQDKLRFVQPFMRFWFGFVSSYQKELALGKGEIFLAHFQQHHERLHSLVYEQLCDALLLDSFHTSQKILSHGSYWNIHSEFDILAITQNRHIILGECKYKDRIVCKNELSKLKAKALESGIKVNTYALFSKSGFSKELLHLNEKNVLLFDLDDLHTLL